MLFEEYPELTPEQYRKLKVGDIITYIGYVLGDYVISSGEIKQLVIKGQSDNNNYYEFAYYNKAILTDGKAVTYYDIIEVKPA